jgi:hypothetical protein
MVMVMSSWDFLNNGGNHEIKSNPISCQKAANAGRGVFKHSRYILMAGHGVEGECVQPLFRNPAAIPLIDM